MSNKDDEKIKSGKEKIGQRDKITNGGRKDNAENLKKIKKKKK